MKDKGVMEIVTIMDTVVDVVMDVVVEDHPVDVDVDVNMDVASNTGEADTVTRTGTAPIPAQNVKLLAQSIKLQERLQT